MIIFGVVLAIQSIFDKIDCPRDSIDDLLGASQGIKENNMMQYLGIVEERTNELLRIKSYVDYKVPVLIVNILQLPFSHSYKSVD